MIACHVHLFCLLSYMSWPVHELYDGGGGTDVPYSGRPILVVLARLFIQLLGLSTLASGIPPWSMGLLLGFWVPLRTPSMQSSCYLLEERAPVQGCYLWNGYWDYCWQCLFKQRGYIEFGTISLKCRNLYIFSFCENSNIQLIWRKFRLCLASLIH